MNPYPWVCIWKIFTLKSGYYGEKLRQYYLACCQKWATIVGDFKGQCVTIEKVQMGADITLLRVVQLVVITFRSFSLCMTYNIVAIVTQQVTHMEQDLRNWLPFRRNWVKHNLVLLGFVFCRLLFVLCPFVYCIDCPFIYPFLILKLKVWLVWNKDNASMWSGLLFQWASTITIQLNVLV